MLYRLHADSTKMKVAFFECRIHYMYIRLVFMLPRHHEEQGAMLPCEESRFVPS